MIVMSEATAGEKPRCIECGAYAHYIELHGSWVSGCGHGSWNLRSKSRLHQELKNAQHHVERVQAEILKFMALP